MSQTPQPKLHKKIIFKKFLIQKFLCSSDFSWVYEGKYLNKDIPVAIKIENNKYDLLESEAYIQMNLKGIGIPKIISFGKHGPYKILIEELLGPTISFLWKSKPFKKDPNGSKNLYIKDLCLLALQAIERLSYVHSKNIIHRDIKDKNFIIGRKDPHIIYLIDFGFSKKYRSSRTGKHIGFSNIKTLIGSVLFTSRYAIKGYESSRRDDLESLGYLLIFFAKGGCLPWSNMYNKPQENRLKTIEKIAIIKQRITEEVLCKGLPEEFIKFMKYVRKLGFEQDPNYKYMKGLFISLLSKKENINDATFFWVKKQLPKKEKKIEKKDDKDNSIYNSVIRRDSSYLKKNQSLKRLYCQIKNSLEKNYKNLDSNILGQSRNLLPKQRNIKSYIKTDKFTININTNTNNLTANNSRIKNITLNSEAKYKPINLLSRKNTLYKDEKNLFKNLIHNSIYNEKSNKMLVNKNNKTFNEKKTYMLYNNINYNNMDFLHMGYFINSDSWKETPLLKKIDIRNKRFPTTSQINDIKLENNIKYYPRFKQ